MNFDTLMMAAATHEIRRDLVGARVARITQPTPLEILIGVYGESGKQTLLYSAESGSARLHVTHAHRSNPPSPPSFCMLLRKYLEGLWLAEIDSVFGLGERVARITFSAHQAHTVYLWLEVMGRYSNAVLTTQDGVILGALKTVNVQMSRMRQIRPGLAYQRPPTSPSAKIDAFSPTAGNLLPQSTFESTADARKWILDTFTGISPLMADESVMRVSGKELSSETIWYGLNDLILSARVNNYDPVQILDGAGQPISAYPTPLRTVPEDRQLHMRSFCDAIDEAMDAVHVVDTLESERKAMLAALRRAEKACEREALDLQEGLLNSDRADEYRESAELLLASSTSIGQGAEVAVVPDYFTDDGTTREIAIDPLLTPAENAESLFRRYRKARDSRERLEQRSVIINDTLQEIAAARAQLASAASIAEIDAIVRPIGDEVARRMAYGAPSSDTAGLPKDRPTFDGHKIRTYHSADGWEILVGENADSNDYLTTRVAEPTDIWLHARSIPSAHAVIRARRKPAAVSSAALHRAAEQVAKRSDGKHARLVPIDYTLRKYVRKPHHAKPGQVTYSHEKTLDVVPTVE
jgi:predicted ribosome quality control (RQC) complex YloA/Tae2 family protein